MLAEILTSLFEDGRLVIADDPEGLLIDDAVRDLLVERDRLVRLTAPCRVPALDLDAACWAGLRLAQLCLLHVHRHYDDMQIRTLFQQGPAPPSAGSVSAIWSVDLVLVFLYDLWRRCRVFNQEDPVVGDIRCLAGRWMLSSVGIPVTDPTAVPAMMLGEPGLMIMYADRIIRRQDADRLALSPVTEQVRQLLGAHDTLAGDFAHLLKGVES